MSGAIEKHMKLAEETLDLMLCNVPEAGDTRAASIRDIAEALAKVERDALERGFLGGFAASGEGWNAEYPFDDNDRNPLSDLRWINLRDAFIEGVTVGNWEAA